MTMTQSYIAVTVRSNSGARPDRFTTQSSADPLTILRELVQADPRIVENIRYLSAGFVYHTPLKSVWVCKTHDCPAFDPLELRRITSAAQAPA